jgi:hypothetical protein
LWYIYRYKYYMLLYLERDVVFQVYNWLAFLPAVASIYPCAQQQKLVKLVLPVEHLMYSSVNMDAATWNDRSFARSGFSSAQQWRKSWWGGGRPPPPSRKMPNFRKFWPKRRLKTAFSSANAGVCRKFESCVENLGGFAPPPPPEKVNFRHCSSENTASRVHVHYIYVHFTTNVKIKFNQD